MDTGVPKLWDSHIGLKPSEVNGQASDNEVEIKGDLPYRGDKEVNNMMVNMMVKLSDCNKHDDKWLLEKERKKLEARKNGNVSFLGCKCQKHLLCNQERGRAITTGLMLPPGWHKHSDSPNIFT